MERVGTTCPLLCTPRDLLLRVLTFYGLSPGDLAALELTCKVFAEKVVNLPAASSSLECGLDTIVSLPEAVAVTRSLSLRSFDTFGQHRLHENWAHFHNSWKCFLQYLLGLEKTQCRGRNVITAGADYSLCVKSNGTVYSFGDGHMGELGYAFEDYNCLPSRVSALVSVEVSQVAAGSTHSIFMARSGVVYACGANFRGCCGVGHDDPLLSPAKMESLESIRIVQVSAGTNFTLLRSEGGEIFTCGDVNSYCLGYHSNESQELVPRKVPTLAELRVLDIAAGNSHVLALAADRTGFRNSVWSWGTGKGGCLGLGSYRTVLEPTLVSDLVGPTAEVQSLAAGFEHSLALTFGGQVYSWGEGFAGCLGHDDNVNEYVPRLVKAMKDTRAVAIAGGTDCSFIVTEAGQVHSCGYGYQGRLGLGSQSERQVMPEVWTPQPLVGLQQECVVQVAASHTSDAVAHVLLLGESGAVFSFGDGRAGQLGRQVEDFSSNAEKVHFPDD